MNRKFLYKLGFVVGTALPFSSFSLMIKTKESSENNEHSSSFDLELSKFQDWTSSDLFFEGASRLEYSKKNIKERFLKIQGYQSPKLSEGFFLEKVNMRKIIDSRRITFKIFISNGKTRRCKEIVVTFSETPTLESELAKFLTAFYSTDLRPSYRQGTEKPERILIDKKIFTSIPISKDNGYWSSGRSLNPKLSEGFTFSVYNNWKLPPKINIGIFTIEVSDGTNTISKDVYGVFKCQA